MQIKSLHQDSLFRTIVVASTGLALASMMASAASVRISQGDGLQFGWHWTILIPVTLVILWNTRFWKLIWKLQDDQTGTTKQKLKFHLAILALLGIGTYLYPIRFIEQSYSNGILSGLLTAVTFVGTFLWIFYRFTKGFTAIDNIELERTAPRSKNLQKQP